MQKTLTMERIAEASPGSKTGNALTYRTTAVVVGGLFIVADVTGVLSMVLQQPDLTSFNASHVATSALLVIAAALAVVGIAIAIYPVLRRFSERLALAYVAIRTLEAMVTVITAIGALTVLTVSQTYASAPDSSLQSLGSVLLAQRDWVSSAVLPIVFAVDALILNYVLYKARLVPRWLSVWGLGAAVLWLAAGVMVTYGLKPASAMSLAVPIGLQEIALALWLIVKGFNAAAFAFNPAEQPGRAAMASIPNET